MLKLKNIKVSYKLAIILLVGTMGFISLLFISANALESNLVAERKARLNAVITSILSQVTYLEKSLPKPQAQNEAKALINSVRFDGNNYLFVIDESRYTIVHPIRPELVGKQMGNEQSSDDDFWHTMVSLGKGGQHGVLTYPWQTAAGKPADKLSAVYGFAPWGWIIGSGMLLDDIEQAVARQFWKWPA